MSAIVTSSPPEETAQLGRLRFEVRSFVREQIAQGSFVPAVDAWLSGWDEEFSGALGERGWLGMTIPRVYGGHERTFIERFVVTEELLAAGAPVAAHWVADRQIAPTLLRFGTEVQKNKYLPAIAQGRCFFGIGMSEPDAGSDLASVRTKAVSVEGGWKITGTKVWTSGAHRAEAFFVLARSAPLDTSDRHAGLSQFIVDLRAPGVEIRPIVSLNGDHHFNEVFLDEVFVPDSGVMGEIGQGWQQVTSELAYERSGPERFLSTFVLLSEVVEAMKSSSLHADAEVGRLIGRTAALHQMSYSVAKALETADPPNNLAAMVKILGTATEGDIVEYADNYFDQRAETAGTENVHTLIRQGLLKRPGFTLRGGTTEILRGVVARGLGMR